MDLRKQYIPVFAICATIIIAAAIIAYKPLFPEEKDETFQFPSGIPPSLGAVTSTSIGDEQVNTISLSGTGSASAQANQATLSVGVQIEKTIASEAVSENAEKMNKVLEEIKSLGITEEDIQTVTYSISPVYDYERKEVREYRVINMVQVKIKNLEQVGAVIDAATSAGANRLDGVSFELSEDLIEQLKIEAYQAALMDASGKAEIVAETLNLQLTGVLMVSENVYYPYTPIRSAEAYGMDAASTPIIEGSLSVSVAVHVVYTFQ